MNEQIMHRIQSKLLTYLIFLRDHLSFSPASRRKPFAPVLCLTLLAVSGCDSSSEVADDEPVVPGNSITVVTNALGSAEPAELSLPVGETAQIMLTPDSGSELISISGCDGELTGAGSFEVQGPVIDCTIYAEFGLINEQLTIDVFGDGEISTTTGTLCTARETCELRSPSRQALQLFATPAPGWTLSHWTGCDDVQNGVCLVSMDGPESVLPAFSMLAEPTLNPDVIILNDNQNNALQEVDDASIIFQPNVEGLDTFDIGKILVSTRGNGFARRITRIIALNQTPVLIQTRPVALTDVIDEGTIVWQGDPADGAALEFIPAEGVTITDGNSRSLNSSITVETVVYDNDNNPATQNDQVRLSVGIAGRFTPDFAFEKRFGREPSIRFLAGASVTTSARLGLNVSLPVTVPVLLGQFRSPPIAVGPIVLLPKYEVFTEVGASVNASLSVSTSFSVGGNVGVYKKSGESWKTLNSMAARAQPPALDNPQVSVSANLWSGINAEFLVYGLAGPFVKAGPTFGYQRTYSAAGDTAGCFKESAYFGADATVGGRIDLILWNATLPTEKLTIRQAEIDWMQDQALRCNEDVYGPPLNLVTSLSDTNTVITRWEPPVGTPLVKYSVYRDNTFLGTIWDLEYIDNTVSANTSHCYYVVGFDRIGRRTARSNESCVDIGDILDVFPPSTPNNLIISNPTTASLELSWDASIDNSGAVSYLVQIGDRVISRSATPTAIVTQLTPGQEYCFTVVAVDLTGNSSAPSALACGSTLPEDAGRWRMRIACVGRDYALENRVDLQSTQEGIVNFAGNGFDYPGTPIAYIVSGLYDSQTQALDGRITYTFESDDKVRVDLFNVDLSTGDSGDVPMQQIQVTGCETLVRFDRLDTTQPAANADLRHARAPAMAINDRRGISLKQQSW